MIQLNREADNPPEVTVNGQIGFVSQKPWIKNATLRENILFDKKPDENKYKACIKYASLEQDIAVF